jgi:hypothetical protein
MNLRTKASLASTVLMAVLVSVAPFADAKDKSEGVSFQAFAVDMSNMGGGAGSLDITIDRWTTPEEAAKLHNALVENGADALTRELQGLKKVGFIRATGGGLGWNIQYAKKVPLPDGGYRVIFATDRPMSFAERMQQPRSADFDLMVAEMRIGADGKGEGKLVPMAKINFDKSENALEIENYATEPVRLSEVREVSSHDKASKDESDKDKAPAKKQDKE